MVGKLKLNNLSRLVDDLNRLLDYQNPQNLNDGSLIGSNITWDITKGYNANIKLPSNCSLILTNLTKGDYGTLEIVQGGTGNNALTIPSNSKVNNSGAGLLMLSTAVGAIDLVGFYFNGTTIYWNLNTSFT